MFENTFLRFADPIGSKNYAKVFPKNVLRIQTKDSNDILFAKYSPKKVALDFIKQAGAVDAAIKTMVVSENSVGHDYIIEGHQIQPRLVNKLLEEGLEIKSVFLIRKDLKQMDEGLQKNKAKRDWVLQKTKQKETYSKIASMIAHYSDYLDREAAKYQLPVFNMDGDFLAKIEEASKFLSEP